MKKLILVFYALATGISGFSQQERQVSHYMYDHVSINPGSAGSIDMVSAHAIIRQQWAGIDGAPTDFILNLSAPFKLGSTHHGAGISVWRDELGFNQDIDLTASYAYQFSVGGGRLGLGISGNFINREINAEWNPVHTSPDDDMAIPSNEENDFAIDLGAGLFYQTDELYVGLSSTRLLESSFEYQKSTTGTGVTEETLKRHFYLTAGYTLPLPNPSLEFLPSVFVASTLDITKIDLNATLLYNKKFWAGVSYRVGSDVVGMLGINIFNGVKIGYAYDFQTSALSNTSKGSHEILVGYSFNVGIDKIPQKYKSIRYL